MSTGTLKDGPGNVPGIFSPITLRGWELFAYFIFSLYLGSWKTKAVLQLDSWKAIAHSARGKAYLQAG
jgi:hypothetical protein